MTLKIYDYTKQIKYAVVMTDGTYILDSFGNEFNTFVEAAVYRDKVAIDNPFEVFFIVEITRKLRG